MKYKWLSAFFGLVIILIGIYHILDPENIELNETVRANLGGTYIRLSDGITHYKLEGPNDGKLVVLVHGGTVPMWTWDKQVKALKTAGYRVLSYDKYGRGYSDRPDVTYDQNLYKRQLLELVDKLALKKSFDLIGLSVGGGTVINFTAQYPHRVRKLIMISPVINNFKVPFFFRIPVIGEFIARLIGVRVIVKRFASLLEKDPNAEEYTALFVEQTRYKGFQKSVLSMLRNDALGDYRKAYQIVGKQKRDVLLIWGTADTEITKEMTQDIRTLIPRLEFKPVEGVGHGIEFKKPYTVSSLILNFLEK